MAVSRKPDLREVRLRTRISDFPSSEWGLRTTPRGPDLLVTPILGTREGFWAPAAVICLDLPDGT